jgi:hypothetical protein
MSRRHDPPWPRWWLTLVHGDPPGQHWRGRRRATTGRTPTVVPWSSGSSPMKCHLHAQGGRGGVVVAWKASKKRHRRQRRWRRQRRRRWRTSSGRIEKEGGGGETEEEGDGGRLGRLEFGGKHVALYVNGPVGLLGRVPAHGPLCAGLFRVVPGGHGGLGKQPSTSPTTCSCQPRPEAIVLGPCSCRANISCFGLVLGLKP